MPLYALICPHCNRKFEETPMTVQEREEAHCQVCGEELETDWSRSKFSFNLKGSDWPSKTNKLEQQILKEGVDTL
jgi:putative FmdB family regulatory protein